MTFSALSNPGCQLTGHRKLEKLSDSGSYRKVIEKLSADLAPVYTNTTNSNGNKSTPRMATQR